MKAPSTLTTRKKTPKEKALGYIVFGYSLDPNVGRVQLAGPQGTLRFKKRSDAIRLAKQQLKGIYNRTWVESVIYHEATGWTPYDIIFDDRRNPRGPQRNPSLLPVGYTLGKFVGDILGGVAFGVGAGITERYLIAKKNPPIPVGARPAIAANPGDMILTTPSKLEAEKIVGWIGGEGMKSWLDVHGDLWAVKVPRGKAALGKAALGRILSNPRNRAKVRGKSIGASMRRLKPN